MILINYSDCFSQKCIFILKKQKTKKTTKQPVVINLRAEHLRTILFIITRKSNPAWQLCSI